MYPGPIDLFLNQYEEAVKRPFGHLLIDLKTTTQDNYRLRTNVLPSEEGFNHARRVSRKYSSRASKISKAAKSFSCLTSTMQEIQDVLSRNDLRDDEKAKRYLAFSCKTDTWI